MHTGPSPNSAVPPSYPPTDLAIRDILERWVGTDETLRAALTAHSAASQRRAEEERTRQEYYRLETRRVEFELLREAFRGGIHPSLVPQLFTQDRVAQGLSPISPIQRHEERPSSMYPTSSLPSYNNRPDSRSLPRIDTSGLPPPGQRGLMPRDKYAGPISAPPASMATASSPPPSIFFRHWAPPQRSQEEIGLRTPREEVEILPSSRYHHDQQIPSPPSTRKSPTLHNSISPKRSSSGSHIRHRSEATKLHDSRHHPYRPLQGKKHDTEDHGTGLGGTKQNLDREAVMRALREKVAPRKEDEKDEEKTENETEKKKEMERKKVEGTRDVMALEQLVENSSGEKA